MFAAISVLTVKGFMSAFCYVYFDPARAARIHEKCIYNHNKKCFMRVSPTRKRMVSENTWPMNFKKSK
jgi:hypothetical protein